MTMQAIPRNLLLLLSTLTLSMPAWAASKNDELYWYKLEVVVFARTNLGVLEHEYWPEDTGHVQPYESLELIPENGDARMTGELRVPGVQPRTSVSTRPEAFQILTPKDYELNQKVYALRKNSGFRVLVHTSWYQPAFDVGMKRAVYLHDKLPLPYAESGDSPTIAIDTVGPEGRSLFGTVRVYVSRFLHVDIDLVYRVAQQVTYYQKTDEFKNSMFLVPQEGNYTTSGEPVTTVAMHGYRLQESRRIKSRELHYFDHPLFGVLLYATPYEIVDEGSDPMKTSGR